MRWLNTLASLSLLTIEHTQVIGEGLSGLANNEYFSLYMSHTPASDEGILAFARRLTNLKALYLAGTNVTDNSAKSISSLPKLDELRLANTKITDVTLEALHGHPKLEALNVEGTEVTEGGIRALKSASPCRITVYSDFNT